MQTGEHFVQFYRDDESLIQALAGYVADGLEKGERVVAIITPAHRVELESRLRATLREREPAFLRERYIIVDAHELLARFMEGGRPNRARFEAIVQELVAGGAFSRVRAFGEMVAVLWAEGNRIGAVELEELWNEWLATYPMTLFCAYPSAAAQQSGAPSLEQVCLAHTCVIQDTN